MKEILIATTNRGKVDEIRDLLEGLDCRVLSLNDLGRVLSVVEETGETFAENAMIKADYYHAQTGLITLADDSGLEVDALDGRPGVYSARYGGDGAGSAEQIKLLLDEMRGVPREKRTARFVCAIALSGPGLRDSFEGRCEGVIAEEPRGEGGFGYDPVFIDIDLGRTFAELSREAKAARSHRGKALRATRLFLERWFTNRQD